MAAKKKVLVRKSPPVVKKVPVVVLKSRSVKKETPVKEPPKPAGYRVSPDGVVLSKVTYSPEGVVLSVEEH